MTSRVLWSSEVQLAPELASASAARAFVAAELSPQESEHVVKEVQLVTCELVTNAVVHAGTPILVAIARLASCIRLTVSDGCDALPRLRPGRGSNGDAEGGRGLWVTEEYSSSWGTESGRQGGKSVWALFELPSPA